MGTPLASLFSTIDSVKRILGDAISDPAQFAHSAGQNVDVSPEAATEVAMNFMPGGMVIPASRALSFELFNKVAKELKDPAGMPGAIFDAYRTYLPKESGDSVLRTIINDQNAIMNPSKAPGNAIAKPTRLADLIDHPKLFADMPELQDIMVSHLKGSTANGRLRGQYNSSANTIQLAPANSGTDLMSTLLHEVQHAIQTNNGMAEGASSTRHLADPEKLTRAVKALKGAIVDPLARQMHGDKKLGEWNKLIKTTTDKSYEGYAKTFGEVEARMTQRQYEGRLGYDVNPNTIMNPTSVRNIQDLTPNPHDPSGNIEYFDLHPDVQKMMKDMGIF
jgi:hypothetical protein